MPCTNMTVTKETAKEHEAKKHCMGNKTDESGGTEKMASRQVTESKVSYSLS